MRLFLVGFAVLASLGACETKVPGSEVEGVWISNTEPPFTLQIKKNGDYHLQLAQDLVEGRWLLRNKRLSLSPNRVNGMTQDEALIKSTREIQEMGRPSFDVEHSMRVWELNLSEDENTLLPTGKVEMGTVTTPITFTRKDPKPPLK